jgi:hypothetical protein
MGIADIGVLALGHGCGQLQMINLSKCRGITDIGISTKSKTFIDTYLFTSRRSTSITSYDETSIRSATRYRGNCNYFKKSQDLVLHKVEE